MGTREENREQRKARIYDEALSLFCEYGYEHVTLSDIAAAAGVSTRTLYRYYPHKQDIMEQYSDDSIAALREHALSLPDDMPLRDKVAAIMLQDYRDMFYLFEMGTTAASRHRDEWDTTAFCFEHLAKVQHIYRELFGRFQQEAGVPSGEYTVLCATIVAAIHQHFTDMFRFKDIRPANEENLKLVLRGPLDIIWNSIERTLIAGDVPIEHLAMYVTK